MGYKNCQFRDIPGSTPLNWSCAARWVAGGAAAVFLGEVPSTRKIVGSCVALLGVLGYGLSKRDAAKKNR